MHRITGTRRRRAGAAKAGTVLALLLLTCLGLAACGSSGSSTTTSASANAAATTQGGAGAGPTGSTGSRSGRFAALRECLAKNGVKLPPATPGQRPRFLGGLAGLPKGVTRGQMEAALKKCGGPLGGRVHRFGTRTYQQRLRRFATCMRANGVHLPEPNFSGAGPVFRLKRLETNSEPFRAGLAKCRGYLR
jgi:hypothetical protein